ncbi:MAG: hypothetical protein ISR47_10310 [Rhodospirillales bacterium]|nr:hypothetical protein [Rhodospirillales bacterium]
MTARQKPVLPALLIVGAILATVSADLGGMPLLRLPAASFLVVYFVLRWPDLSAIGRRMLFLALALGAAAVAFTGSPLELALAALRPGLFLAVFISCVNMLRTAARQSPFVRRCGTLLVNQSPGRRYTVLSLGSAVAAVILLFSVLNLFGTMIVRGQERNSPAVRRSVLAMLRGFALTPCISPLALPFAAISTTYTDLDWAEAAPFIVTGILSLWGLGWLVDFVGGRRGAGDAAEQRLPDGDWTDYLRIVVLVGVLVAAIFALKETLGIGLGYGVIFAAPVFALCWMIARRWKSGFGLSSVLAVRRIAVGMGEDRNELAILFAAGVAGVSISRLLPVDALARAMDAIAFPPFMIPVAITLIFVLAGQLAFQPVMIFVIVAAVLPDVQVLGLPPVILFATYFLAWGLMSVSSPFNVCTLVAAHLAGIDSFTLCWRWNAVYWVLASTTVAVLMAAFALVL